MPEDVRESLLEIIEKSFGFQVDIDNITDESRLVEDLGMDSLDQVELVVAIEEAMDINLDDDDVTQWVTVGDIISYLEDI